MTAKKNKYKLDRAGLKLAQRYEIACHKLYYKKARFIQEEIINEPHGRHANEFAKEVRRLAENDDMDLEVSGMIY